MTYHPSYHTPKARNSHIDKTQTSGPRTPAMLSAGVLRAELIHAARVVHHPEAIEQLRILANITTDAHEAFVAGSIEAEKAEGE